MKSKGVVIYLRCTFMIYVSSFPYKIAPLGYVQTITCDKQEYMQARPGPLQSRNPTRFQVEGFWTVLKENKQVQLLQVNTYKEHELQLAKGDEVMSCLEKCSSSSNEFV